MSSRSANDRYLPDSGFAAGLNIAGGIPPASRNHLVPTGCDTPALIAAASLLIPVAINVQNSCRSLRVVTGGRPGDRNGGRPHRSDRRFRMPIATSFVEVLRRPVESAQFTSTAFTAVLHREQIAISMDGKGRWRDNVFVERLWRSVKYEEVYLHAYASVPEARAGIAR
jgi:putative transposase